METYLSPLRVDAESLESQCTPKRNPAAASLCLRPCWSRILAHCRYPCGTNLVEGISNQIIAIKRMAYAFSLKNCAVLLGVGR